MTLTTVLFDLDNTLYPASSGLLRHVDSRIGAYVQNFLGVDPDEARRIRHHYFTDYGTTLRGLQTHHDIDPEDYLAFVHDMQIDTFLAVDAELDRLLGQVRLQKAIFTNAPAEHAERVLEALGIARHFERIFDIRFCQFRPKPDPHGYRCALETLGSHGPQTIFVEDTPRNLVTARELGITTILISQTPTNGSTPHADYITPDILAALEVVLRLQDNSAGDRP